MLFTEMLFQSCIAFVTGGLVCVIAQILIDKTALTPARILVLYVSFGVFLGAIGVFEPLAEAVGCGITVPLIGFGGNIAKGMREAINEQGLIGILSGGFTAAAVGCASALLFGYMAALCFSGKPKRASKHPLRS